MGKLTHWVRRMILVGLALSALVFLFLYIRSWFLLREFETYTPPEAATIFDRHGEVIAHLGGGQAEYLTIDQIPQYVQDATVAVEDRRFYRHFGLDPIRIIGALIADIKAGAPVQGASTITQQLAKNAFLTPAKTIGRKIEEAVLAIVLEQRYTKEKILELYLNTIDYGQGAIGIENAAEIFFDKDAAQLTLAEAALLAGLPRAPSAYDPFRNLPTAVERRNLILDLMADQGYITAAMAQEAKSEEPKLSARIGGKAPYFVDYVTAQLIEQFGRHRVYRSGLRVQTTLDLELQSIAQAALSGQDLPGALVALDPHTGDILAMVGGTDYGKSQFNRATQAIRQPGSAFKPFVYATALAQGWRTNSLVADIYQDFRGYRPQNWDDEYWGWVTMKYALAHSLNTASVWLLDQIGIGNVIALLERLGFTTLVLDSRIEPNDRNLSLALGGLTQGVTPLQLAAAYAPFANGGRYYPPRAIVQVMDNNGLVLFSSEEPMGSVVLDEAVAFLVTDMLQGTLDFGTGRLLDIDRAAAGKTGSTNEQNDAWFIGYTPELLAAVFLGHDLPKSLGGYGGALAGPIWAEFIENALKGRPKQDFPAPASIISDLPIHVFSGLLGAEDCPWVKPHSFIRGTQPHEYTDCWRPKPQGEGAEEPEAGP